MTPPSTYTGARNPPHLTGRHASFRRAHDQIPAAKCSWSASARGPLVLTFQSRLCSQPQTCQAHARCQHNQAASSRTTAEVPGLALLPLAGLSPFAHRMLFGIVGFVPVDHDRPIPSASGTNQAARLAPVWREFGHASTERIARAGSSLLRVREGVLGSRRECHTVPAMGLGRLFLEL